MITKMSCFEYQELQIFFAKEIYNEFLEKSLGNSPNQLRIISLVGFIRNISELKEIKG